MKHPKVSWQPARQPWALTELARGEAMALANSVAPSTQQAYGSALNSWLAFVEMHHFPFEPSLETLSYFIVYMSHHINPRSVKSYLSGLVQQLEPDYPAIRDLRSSRHISKVMRGCLKMNTKAITRKNALTLNDLQFINHKFRLSSAHDDLLFVALLNTGFHGLLRLGELTFPDNHSIRDWRKVIRRRSLVLRQHEYEFLLPAHKADRFFEGNRVLIRAFSPTLLDPVPVFSRYLASRDRLFPAATPLWVTSKGEVPTRSFFLSRFYLFFSKLFGGASIRAGGATHLAQLGTSAQIIRAMGRWSSDAWEIYIRVHPVLLQALLHCR
jgi:hypothetical protein